MRQSGVSVENLFRLNSYSTSSISPGRHDITYNGVQELDCEVLREAFLGLLHCSPICLATPAARIFFTKSHRACKSPHLGLDWPGAPRFLKCFIMSAFGT